MKYKEGDRIICIDNLGMEKSLTLNEQYVFIKTDNIYLSIMDKYGKHIHYLLIERFKLDEKYYRKEKLNQLRNEI
jgi:hypothetical protein